MEKKRSKLFSVSIKDCEIQTFCGSGKGGQNRNKTANCCRLIHHPSNSMGIGREGRSLEQNKRTAFRQLAESKKFNNWIKVQVSKLEGKPSIEELVEKDMEPKNLKIEVIGIDGNFIIEDLC